jgi:hypothetical protein
MNLMLTFIVICAALGLLAPRLGRREYLTILFLATVMSLLYWRFGARFM